MADYTQIIQEINTNLPDNTTQAITAAKVRTTLIDMVNAVGETDYRIEEILSTKQDVLDFDTTPRPNSVNPVVSDGIYQALQDKEDRLTFDTAPAPRSVNPVTSDGIYNALSGKTDKVSNATDGNFAGLDLRGNLTDSGSKASDFATAAQGALAETAIQTITVGTTTTGAAGTDASVTNSGTSTNPVLNFTIPRGATGATGANGQDGADAYNPFKGTYLITDTLPTTGQAGDYIYVVDSQTPPVTHLYAWNGTAFADTLETVTIGNAQFANSTKLISQTNVVNDLTTGGTEDVLSAEQGKVLGEAAKDTIKGVYYNLFNKDADGFINGKFINTSGTLVNNENSMVSYLITIKPNTVYSYVPKLPGTGAPNSNMYIRFVANDGVTPLKPINPNTDEEINYANTWGRITIKSPSSAKYIQFTIVHNGTIDYRDTAQLVEGNERPTEYHAYKLQLPESQLPYGYESLPTDVENLNDRVSAIEEILPNKAEYSIEKGVNLFNKDATDFEDNKRIGSNGTLLTSNGSRTSPLIEVEPNTLYAICRGVKKDGLYLRFVAEDRSTPLKALNPTDDTEINYSAIAILGNSSGNLILKSPATAKYVQFVVIYTGTDITATAQVIQSDELPTEYYPYWEREIIPMNHLPKEVEDMVNSDINVVDEIIENSQNPVRGGAIYDAIVAANPLWKKTIRYDGDSIGAGGALTVLKGWSKLIGDRNKNTWSSMAVGGGTITSGTYAKRAWTNGSTTLFTKNEIFTKCYTNSEFTEGEQTIESQSFNSYIVVGGVTYNFNQQESTKRHWICEGIDTLISQGMTADYIVFEGGTNDEVLGNFTNENNLPERFGVFSATDYSGNYDKTTFCGALDYLFYKAATEYPYAKFGFIIAQKMGTGAAARNRRAIFSYVMRSCEKWGIPYINLWDGSFLNPSLLAQCDPSQTVEQNIADGKLYTDSQHLTAYGYNAVTSKIEHWMKGL